MDKKNEFAKTIQYPRVWRNNKVSLSFNRSLNSKFERDIINDKSRPWKTFKAGRSRSLNIDLEQNHWCQIVPWPTGSIILLTLIPLFEFIPKRFCWEPIRRWIKINILQIFSFSPLQYRSTCFFVTRFKIRSTLLWLWWPF